MISCRECALKLLAFKDRTEKEIADRLAQKGYSEENIAAELVFLKEYGYIDDRLYARRFTNDAVKLKKWGKSRIRTELLRRGIDKAEAEEILEELCGDSQECIKQEIQRKFGGADFNNMKERNRVFGYFARRGFNPSEIRGAINDVCSLEDYEEF